MEHDPEITQEQARAMLGTLRKVKWLWGFCVFEDGCAFDVARRQVDAVIAAVEASRHD
jgi:hypothetical protein